MGRKVYKGFFVDRPFVDYGDCDLIGAHKAVNRENANIARTRALEYYVYDDSGKAIAIGDVTIGERFLASLRYTFKLNKSRVVGYRSSSPNYANFRLGITYDSEGNEIVNEGYYTSAIEHVLKSDMPSAAKRERIASIEEKLEMARRSVASEELGDMLDESTSEKVSGNSTGNSKK